MTNRHIFKLIDFDILQYFGTQELFIYQYADNFQPIDFVEHLKVKNCV